MKLAFNIWATCFHVTSSLNMLSVVDALVFRPSFSIDSTQPLSILVSQFRVNWEQLSHVQQKILLAEMFFIFLSMTVYVLYLALYTTKSDLPSPTSSTVLPL